MAWPIRKKHNALTATLDTLKDQKALKSPKTSTRPRRTLEEVTRAVVSDVEFPADLAADLDDEDAIDRLLDVNIARSRRSNSPHTLEGSDDPADLFEAAVAVASDEHLAVTADKPVSYALQSSDEGIMALAVPDELLAPDADIDIFIDQPVDYRHERPRPLTEEERLARWRGTVGAEFAWNTQKTYAAGFAAFGLTPTKIAALVGTDPDSVQAWMRSPFFRSRVRKIADNTGRLTYELFAGHQLLLGRHLIAIAISGSKENETQLRAIAKIFDLMEFKASKFIKQDDSEKNPQLAGLLGVLEGEVRHLDRETNPSYDPSYDWVEREIGPELVAATADAKKAIEYDNAKLLNRTHAPLTDPNDAAELVLEATFSASDEALSPTKRKTAADLLADALAALPEPPGATLVPSLLDLDDLVTSDALAGFRLLDPDRGVDFNELVALRLEDGARDDVLARLFARQMKGKQWRPIIGLDSTTKTKIQQRRTTRYAQDRARAGKDAPRRSYAPRHPTPVSVK